MRSLFGFIALTFLVTWALWIAATWVSASPAPALSIAGFRRPLFYLGVATPALVALWLTARVDGRAGVRAVLSRLLEWRVPARWYVFAIGYMVAIKLSVALVYRVATGEWPRFGGASSVLLAVVATLAFFWGQAGEEIGWRGYALPRLATRLGLGGAGILLGVMWAAWHLPLFFVTGADTYGQSFPLYLLQVTALSVAITWLYAHTNGSLLLVMLMHSAINQAQDIVPPASRAPTNPFTLDAPPLSWITLALLWMCAAYFLVRMPTVAAPPLQRRA